MDLGIRGKTALVAASSRGIGRATALALSAEGCQVVCCSRHLDEVMSTAEEIARETGQKVLAFEVDLTVPEQIEKLVIRSREALGTIDILINNCGGPPPGQFTALDEQSWKNAYDTTLMSTVRLTRYVLPDMRTSAWGRIINMTSISVKQPVDGLILSNAFRAGVAGMSKTLAGELGPEGITVNTVAPGFTMTQRLQSLFEARARERGVPIDLLLDQALEPIPLHRFAEPDEIASAVLFLASEQAKYITGTILPVDGGFIRGY
jgi:3-oxoacyl-[acyl-carrier protein] reductase